MDEVNQRFQHLSIQIFDSLDNQSVLKCMEVNSSWCDFLEKQKFLQIRIIQNTVGKFDLIEDSWKEIYRKSNAEILIDLKIAVAKFYEQNPYSFYHELTPIHIAAHCGDLTLYNKIQERAGNKCPRDSVSRTPQYYAAKNGPFQLCAQIMAENVDKNPKTKAGFSPLHAAAQNGHLEVCRLIIENISDKNPKHISGYTLYSFTCCCRIWSC